MREVDGERESPNLTTRETKLINVNSTNNLLEEV